MSFSKVKQKELDKTAVEATQRVMSFELGSKRLSKGLGAQIERVERERVLNLISGREIGEHLLRRYKIQIWAVYTVVVTIALLVVIL